ncbi:hypothetical protein WJX74_008796 [Apatococcus lobatus]|uniref:Uncharacterized protein n=2 Tax=Apatococcus TaxID=904362 RepID=A0AAW1RX66_9CHLO
MQGTVGSAEEVSVDLEGRKAPANNGLGQAFSAPRGEEVVVEGLPAETTDQAVKEAFSAAGEVLAVDLQIEKGFGTVSFATLQAARRACVELKEVCGRLVSVHMSNEAKEEQQAQVVLDQEEVPFSFDADPDSSINKLLRLLRSHPNRRTAVAAALKAVETTSQQKGETAETLADQLDQGEDQKASELISTEQPEQATQLAGSTLTQPEVSVGEPVTLPAAAQPAPAQPASSKQKEEEVPLLDLAQLLAGFPKCNHLIETFRTSPNTQNKTPLAVLHEYATRLSLELAYNESAETNLGPFNVEARLTSVGGAVLYATGSGKGRGKKDAKQVAAAAVLEMLLANVSESDFLQPGKAKQAKHQPQMLADGAFGRIRGGRGLRAPRGGSRTPRGMGRIGMQGATRSGPFTPSMRGTPHFMGGRGSGSVSGDMFGTPQSMGMQGPFGRGSPYSDVPGQKRNFAAAMNVDMLGGGSQVGMGGIAPLGAHMLDAPGGFDNSMQDLGMGTNLYGQLNPQGFNSSLTAGPQAAFDLSQGLDVGAMGGQYNPGNEPFPTGPPGPIFGGLPHQFQHLGPGY